MPARPGKEYNIMATCKKCGADMDENAKQCPVCGAPVEQDQGNSNSKQNAAEAAFTEFNNTADTTAEFDSKDIADNKGMAVLAYIGILFLIPLCGYHFLAHHKPCQFHLIGLFGRQIPAFPH